MRVPYFFPKVILEVRLQVCAAASRACVRKLDRLIVILSVSCVQSIALSMLPGAISGVELNKP